MRAQIKEKREVAKGTLLVIFDLRGEEIDFRPGGAWRIAHRGPDREIPVFFGEYREIVRPERFVWTFGFEGMPGEPGPERMGWSPGRRGRCARGAPSPASLCSRALPAPSAGR